MILTLHTMLILCLAIGHISNQKIPIAAKFTERRCQRSNDPLLDSYHAKALVPKGGYSRENIESLFRWYLRKHERDTDLLKLEIHIEDKTYRTARLCDPISGAIIEPPVPGANRERYNKDLEKLRLSEPIAIFSRGRRELIINPDYLYRYWWIPDPSKPDDFEIVDFKP